MHNLGDIDIDPSSKMVIQFDVIASNPSGYHISYLIQRQFMRINPCIIVAIFGSPGQVNE